LKDADTKDTLVFRIWSFLKKIDNYSKQSKTRSLFIIPSKFCECNDILIFHEYFKFSTVFQHVVEAVFELSVLAKVFDVTSEQWILK
jgi:hypothetical protein